MTRNDESMGIEDELTLMYNRLSNISSSLEYETIESFKLVISYYEDLATMGTHDRNSDLYSMKSTYSLLQLSATYDIAVKEIFSKTVMKPVETNEKFSKYLNDILDVNILNRYMTNIKHDGIKKKFKITLDSSEPSIQTCVNNIDTLIRTRNTIAHELHMETKGHNDIQEALLSVLEYLNWYKNELVKKVNDD